VTPHRPGVPARVLPFSWVAAYPRLVRAAMQVALTYRARVVFSLAGALFPVLLLFVWLTVTDDGVTADGWDTTRITSYYVALALVNSLATSDISWTFDADLRSGELSARLLRPVPVLHQLVAADIGSRIVTGSLLFVVVAVATVAVPAVMFPAGVTWALATVAATVLAFCLSVLMSATFGVIGFWSTQSNNVYMVWWGTGAFVSGLVAPLALMPDWLQGPAVALPFRYALGFPVEIAIGSTVGGTATGFAIALAWIAVFAVLYHVLWQRGVRRHQAVGG
jgi:ABC-2 type transport system permease protein